MLVDVNWMGKEPKTGHGVSRVEGIHRYGVTGEGSQALLWSAVVRGLSCRP